MESTTPSHLAAPTAARCRTRGRRDGDGDGEGGRVEDDDGGDDVDAVEDEDDGEEDDVGDERGARARGGRRGEVRWRGGPHGSGFKNMCGLVPRGGVARVAIEGVHEGLEGGPDRDPF